MYKGFQEELFKSNWGVNSGFKHLADKLNALLPFEGRCDNPLSKNKNLEIFRRAQNAAYDFFNILIDGILLLLIHLGILLKIVGICGKITLKKP